MPTDAPAPDDDALAALRRDLLAEALEVARAAPAAARERLLARVAGDAAHLTGFDAGAAIAAEVATPARRAALFGALALQARTAAQRARARDEVRTGVEAVLAAGAAPVDADGAPDVAELVQALADVGDFELAARLCARFPADERAPHRLVDRLHRAGRRDEALAVARRAPAGANRDELLATVANEAVACGDQATALAAAQEIGDRWTREERRLAALWSAAGEAPGAREGAVLGAVRDPLSLLLALELVAGEAREAEDAEGLRGVAVVAARVATTAVDGGDRERALALAASLQRQAGDPRGALATARAMPPGPGRTSAVESALAALLGDDDAPIANARAVLALARDDDEREIVAEQVALAYLERGDLAGARRWVRRLTSADRREWVQLRLDEQKVARRGSASVGRALRDVAPADRTGAMLLALLVEQLRAGDDAGARATIAEFESRPAPGGAWAVWSVAGLAARHGQAAQLRDWARAHLDAPLRVAALLGAAGALGLPPRGDAGGGPPFTPPAAPRSARRTRRRPS